MNQEMSILYRTENVHITASTPIPYYINTLAIVRPTDSIPYVVFSHLDGFLARGGRYVQLEGNDRPRNVVARFPSVEAAVECYNSPAYQAALSHAKGASERDLMVVEEVEG